ncbi:TetR/AcrR family transcriptional regulator [Adlercreutzia sp. ZJ138]|uniref:TetR/AcrR family transcriptional regulator n=1 Tax=Adlercreutzia sp. ZJ138 TaxID=2709405 RepID=UPI0013EB0316|nr:TetR/AcrR family transcriptional regulator [Adlercreutzia sp. ZJ138]
MASESKQSVDNVISEMHRPTKFASFSIASSTDARGDTITATPKKRKRGRPRKTNEGTFDQSKVILNAAIELFAKQGYQATTMSQIAEAAGYNQSSLYYWYKRKEDLLNAILEKTDFSLRTASRIASLNGDKITQLYSVLYSDVYMMCSLPCDFHNLEDVAVDTKGALDGFFTNYQQLVSAIRLIIEEGIYQGDFIKVDPAQATFNALSLNEGIQHRYHYTQRYPDAKRSMIDGSVMPMFLEKEQLAHHAASSTLSHLAPNCNPNKIRIQARDNNWI